MIMANKDSQDLVQINHLHGDFSSWKSIFLEMKFQQNLIRNEENEWSSLNKSKLWAWTMFFKYWAKSQIRKQMSGPDLHVFTLKSLALKNWFPPIKNTFQFFFDFYLPLFYATFQCWP